MNSNPLDLSSLEGSIRLNSVTRRSHPGGGMLYTIGHGVGPELRERFEIIIRGPELIVESCPAEFLPADLNCAKIQAMFYHNRGY